MAQFQFLFLSSSSSAAALALPRFALCAACCYSLHLLLSWPVGRSTTGQLVLNLDFMLLVPGTQIASFGSGQNSFIISNDFQFWPAKDLHDKPAVLISPELCFNRLGINLPIYGAVSAGSRGFWATRGGLAVLRENIFMAANRNLHVL